MNTPKMREIFPSAAKENTGIVVLCRGFLTKAGGKRSAFARDVNKAVVP